MVITLPSLITQLNEARARYLDLVSQTQNDTSNNSNEKQFITKIRLIDINVKKYSPFLAKMDNLFLDGEGTCKVFLNQLNFLSEITDIRKDYGNAGYSHNFYGYYHNRNDWYYGSGKLMEFGDEYSAGYTYFYWNASSPANTKKATAFSSGIPKFIPIIIYNE